MFASLGFCDGHNVCVCVRERAREMERDVCVCVKENALHHLCCRVGGIKHLNM